jgi:hypothetical protein
MNGDEFHYLFLCQNEVIQMEEKKVYSTVFCSKFKTECCHYAINKYWITINFSDKYCETIIFLYYISIW